MRCQASSNEKTKVEKLSSCDHQAIFLPKFHCELNPIECCWCHSKCYTRSHCDYTFPGQLATINNSLDSVTLDMIRKFFRKTRETMRAHREGLTPGPEMTKTYKFKVIVEFQQLINYLDCVLKLFCLVEIFYWLYCFIFLSFEANTYCSDLIILLNFKPKITRAIFIQIWLCRNLWNDVQTTGALFEVFMSWR